MKKANKIILITALICVAAGVCIAAIPLTVGRSALKNQNAEPVTKTVTEKISKLNIIAREDDIIIMPSDTKEITVSYTTGETKQYNFSAENGTLSIEAVSPKKLNLKWYERICIGFDDDLHKIMIRVPSDFSAELDVNSDYGDIDISGIGGSAKIQADCGDVDIENCKLSNLSCDVDYGDAEIKNVSADKITVRLDCGDAELENSITNDLSIVNNYGDIDINRITANNISLDNDCGDIEGSIIGNEADYRIEAQTNAGANNLLNKSEGQKSLSAKTDFGDIDIKFIR